MPCGLERRLAVWLHSQKGVTPVTDGIRDGWKTSCRGDVFIPDELVPFDLQKLPLTLHMKGLCFEMSPTYYEVYNEHPAT